MKDFSKDILHTIEKQHIEPKPRWVFLARQAALLCGFILSVFIGCISVSVILFSLGDADWGASGRMMRMHPGSFLITYLPYIWVLFLVLFGIVAYYEMRQTKGGYRYRSVTILGASLFASFILGVVLHSAGAGQFTDRRFAQAIPQYRGLDARKMNMWMRPQDGMIAGRIISGSATTSFVLEDFKGARWTVTIPIETQRGVDIPTEWVKVIGAVSGPGSFRAVEIFPWGHRAMMNGIEGAEGFSGGRGPGMAPR